MMHTDINQNSKQVVQTHEQRMNQALMQQRKNISKINKAIKYLDSKDPAVVVKGLNVLTTKTFDMGDSSQVHLETFPELTLSIGCLLDVLSPWATLVIAKTKDNCSNLVLSQSDSWATIVMPVDSSRLKLSLMNENPMVLTLLNIIRNLSFESANEFLLSSSYPIMAHLIGILMASIQAHCVTEYAQLAFDILVNIGGRIDLTGRRRLQNWLYIDDGRVPEDRLKSLNLLRYSDHLSAISSVQYVNTVSLLLPIIEHIFDNMDNSTLSVSKSLNRFMIVRALELFSKLGSTSENSLILSKAPDSILDSVVSVLFTSHALSEPITADSYIGDPMGRSRPPAVTFLPTSQSGGNGNNFLYVSDFCGDLELRDLAIDAIASVSSNSMVLASRFAETSNCIEFLYRIAISTGSTVNTSTGYNAYANTVAMNRTEGNLKAIQILSTLLSVPEVSEKFFAIRSNLYVAACSDEAIADVVCNKAALVYQWVVAPPPVVVPAAGNVEGGLSSYPSGVFSTS